jgi:hypothetical protein
MSRSASHHRAAVPGTAEPEVESGTAGPEVAAPEVRRRRFGRRQRTVVWTAVVAAGVACLLLAAFGIGPEVLARIGGVTVGTAYVYGLAARTGGRPIVYSLLTLLVGIGVAVVDKDQLRTGAAVMVAAASAVLGVMGTTPAVRFARAVRECLTAVLVAAIGSLAAIGFDPVVVVSRYQYAVLLLALVGVFVLVYRLGAGLHGLGRRGVVVVALGAVILAATLLYAELIRRYGTPGLVRSLFDGVRWCRHHLGGYPRPIEALLGVPALVWGTHMRARRRQGWWVCAFGIAATAPIAATLGNPEVSVGEALVTAGYSVVVGLVIGYVVIRIDLFLTGSPARGTRVARSDRAATGPGRRAAREAEDAAAVRPEPARTQALL